MTEDIRKRTRRLATDIAKLTNEFVKETSLIPVIHVHSSTSFSEAYCWIEVEELRFK